MSKPRGLGRYKTSFSQREMYNDYKANRKRKSKITRDQFFQIVTKFNKSVIKLMLYKNLHFQPSSHWLKK